MNIKSLSSSSCSSEHEDQREIQDELNSKQINTTSRGEAIVNADVDE